MMWLELALLLTCILIGARIGGIGLGIVAGVGLACFVVRLRDASRPATEHRARHDRSGRDGARGHGSRRRSGTRRGARRACAARQPARRDHPRAARHVRPHLHGGDAARRLRAASRHRRGVGEGRRASRATALDERDRGAARLDRVADLGGDRRPAGGARRRRRAAAEDPAGRHPGDADRPRRRCRERGVAGRRAGQRSRVPPPAGRPDRRRDHESAGCRCAGPRSVQSRRNRLLCPLRRCAPRRRAARHLPRASTRVRARDRNRDEEPGRSR